MISFEYAIWCVTIIVIVAIISYASVRYAKYIHGDTRSELEKKYKFRFPPSAHNYYHIPPRPLFAYRYIPPWSPPWPPLGVMHYTPDPLSLMVHQAYAYAAYAHAGLGRSFYEMPFGQRRSTVKSAIDAMQDNLTVETLKELRETEDKLGRVVAAANKLYDAGHWELKTVSEAFKASHFNADDYWTRLRDAIDRKPGNAPPR